jgi:transposase
MNAREVKAKELADRGRVVCDGSGWVVFSLTSPEKYQVSLEPPSCGCPDWELRQEERKHILAVRLTVARRAERMRPGPHPERPPVDYPRKTYKQDWPNYEAAQVNEQDEFMPLLRDLCCQIQEEPRPLRGRPPLPLADVVFRVCLKVYTTLSVRRFMSDLRGAHEKGYLSQLPHHNSVSRYLESETLTPILTAMIVQSSLPLKELETEFAVDSSGFSSCRHDRWYDERYGRMRSENSWVKAHVMSGTRTHVVTSAEVREKDSADAPQFKPLVKTTAVGFKIEQVSADKAYCNLENHEAVAAVGGKPYLAFKSNATGEVGGLYEKMYHYFCANKEDFLRRYHRRSNVESVFSAIKRVFGDFVRSKADLAMRNEVLCKIVCHNIVCLVHSMYELGIDVNYESKGESDSKMILKFPY